MQFPFPPKIIFFAFEIFEINKYLFLNEMIFIYLFYAIGRTDCQLTQGHILEWMFYGVLWGFIVEWWFIGGQNENLKERKKEKISKICTIM